ncbi:MAG: bifunctional riboflavin kinase/FAD synthetase, partial [Candidatus Aerophobetes bacterium]|nr:bifunctional riboflavin kinase/FAD synthetase [Candidatus Aerophobetes bacterium]
MEAKLNFPHNEEYKHVILTIGFYDGVHLGHQKIIKNLVQQATTRGKRSCVITFTPHPSEFFSRKSLPLLTTREEKREILNQLGVDLVINFSFISEFASQSPSSFMRKLKENLEMEEIIIGEDFVFGKDRKGDVNWLKEREEKFGYKLKVIPLLRVEGKKLSSSLIRNWLKKGYIRKVIHWLGRPPTISGRVIKGKRRGKLLGYPTANLEPHSCKLLPCAGVYAGRIILRRGIFKGIINVGGSPTFGENSVGVEAHILKFKEDIYEERVKIELMDKIREIRKFSSSFSLVKRLEE